MTTFLEANNAFMDEEAKEHKRLSNLALGDLDKLKADRVAWGKKRKDILEKLEQSNGEVKRLSGEVEIHDGKLVNLRNDIRLAQEVRNRFNSR